MNALVELITSPTGSLAYHLVLTFTFLGALQGVLTQTDERTDAQRERLTLGLGLLLALRGALFLAAGLAMQGIARLDLLLPVIDRGVGLVSLVVVVWLWVAPRAQRELDATALLAAVAAALVSLLAVVYWATQGVAGTLNVNGLTFVLDGLAVLIILAGELALISLRPASWGTGLALLVVLFVGTLAQLVAPNPGDLPAWLRLAQLAAMPLLFTLPRQLALAVQASPVVETPAVPAPAAPVAEAEPASPAAPPAGLPLAEFRAILNLAATDKPEEICQLLTRQLARGLVADVVLLVTPPDSSGQVIVMCGYDLIREDGLGGAALDQKVIPGFAEALSRGRNLQIPTSAKLDSLARSLGLKTSGNLLALPLPNDEGKALAAIVLLSPYSGRVWSADDQLYLKEAAPLVADLLQKTQRSHRMRETMLAAEAQLRDSLQEQERLGEEHRAALAEVEVLRSRDAEAQRSVEELENQVQQLRAAAMGAGAAVVATAAGTDERAAAVEAENEKLRKELTNFERLKKAAQTAATERDQLRAELEAARQSVAGVPPAVAAPGLSSEQAEVIASIAQDLRQPMSSIIGYTDLLLSESVGILGALQRKFLDRVKASTERMNGLVGNLVQITALDSGNVHITPEAVDLSAVIDQSIGETSGQLREKNIALRVDLANDLPRMHTDKDAIQQILTHLLSNAGAATPMEGEIALAAHLENQKDVEATVLVEVRDSGEGISEEDMPRVFSRLYRADNPLIQGVGDTGVGLSIAKTLTEALGGVIWVESKLGQGSTFRVRLPVVAKAINGHAVDEVA